MATIDQNSVIPDAIDQNSVIPDGPPAPRGALSEIGTGALRGVLSGAPEGIGKTLQFLGADQAGGAVRQFGENMGQQPWLQARPEGHGMVTNTLAQAAEGVGSFAPVIAASAVNPLAGLALGAEQMAGGAGQDTLEKAQAKGVSPEAADTAARLNSAQSFAMGLAGGAVGGKMLGLLGGPISRVLGMEGAPMAEGILNDLTGQSGVLKPFLKQLPTSAIEATAVMTGQAGLQAGIEGHYGIDDTDPLSAMAGQIGPALGLTAIMSPLGLASRALGVRSAKARTEQLAGADNAPEVRTQLADQYATALAKVDPAKAAVFRQNAQNAIETGQGLPVDPRLFTPDTITGLPRTTQGQGDMFGAGEASPWTPPQPGQGEMFGTPASGAPAKTADQIAQELQDAARRAGMNLSADNLADSYAALRAAGVYDAPTHEAQIAALKTALDNQQGMSTHGAAMAMLHDKWAWGTRGPFGDAPETAATATGPTTPPPGQADMFNPAVPPTARTGGQHDLFPGQTDMFGTPDASRWPDDRPGPQGEMFGNPPSDGGSGGGGTPAQRGQGDLFPVEPDTSQGKLTLWPSEGGYVPRLPAPPDSTGPGTMYVNAQGQAVRGRPGFAFPDGTATNDPSRVHAFINGLPEAERPAAWAQGIGIDLTPAVGPQLVRNEKTVDDLHGQVKDALTAAGVETAQPMDRATFGQQNNLKGQELAKAYKAYLADPATKEALMREDAASYEKMAAERDAAPEPSLNKLADNAAPEDRTNTQLADAMNDALRQKQVDDAYAAYDAHREAERSAIANRTAGEQLADSVENEEGWRPSTVEGDVNAPKQLDEITRDADAVKQANDGAAGPTMRAFDARVNKLGLDQLDTHEAQIDAVDAAIRKGGMSDKVSQMMENLVARWRADMPAKETAPEEAKPAPAAEAKAPQAQPELPAAPVQADTLGQNIETPSPANSEPPRGTEVVTESMPTNLDRTPKQRAGDLLTRLQTVLADFHTRAHNGEPIKDMSALEQQRYNDAREMKAQLTDIHQGKTTVPGEDWWRTMQDFVGTAERPYTKPLESLVMPDPQSVDPGLMAPAILSHRLSDLLTHLATNGSQPWVKTLAQRLNELGLNTGVFRGSPDGKAAGTYDMRNDAVHITPGGESEQVILHEAVHAALSRLIDMAGKIGVPRTQAEALLKRAWQDIEAVRTDALKSLGTPRDPFDPLKKAMDGDDRTYGLTNDQEFAAELMTNKDFQDFLRGQGTQKSLWSKAVDAARRLLGLKVDGRTALEKAMDATNVLMDAAKNSREFDASPEGAAKATDATLNSFAKAADRMGERVPLSTVGRGVFRNALGAKTVDFVAHQLDVWPAMVKSGMANAANAFRAARDSRRIAAEHLGTTLGHYSSDVQRTLRATDDPRGWGEKMMRIGGSAAIGQFDYRKNFADNNRPFDQGGGGRTLDADMKAHVDEIHRQFRQLEQAQPALAKALVDGEKQNRKMLIQQVSTLTSNLISAQTGVAPRLEAELARLPLDDANRAKLQERIQLAKLDATFAAKHLQGLDFMSPDLKTANNGLPDFHLDGASSAMGARLAAMFKDAADMPQGTALKAPLAELSRIYSPQVRNPYFSLGRSGDHFVNIAFKGPVSAQTAAKLNAALDGTNKVLGNLDGQTHAFFRVDTLDQAQGLYQKLVNAGGDALDVPASSRGRLDGTDMQSAAGISPALRALSTALDDAVDMGTLNAGQRVDMKQTLQRTLLSMLPETAARSAKMERRGVPGYDGDFAANFARRASGAVQDLSNAYTNRAFGSAQDEMKASIARMNRGENGATADEAARAQSVADELNTRYANGMKPVDNTHVNLLNSFGHTFYLAASPAFYIRTMAQPYHRGLPILGARYGFVSAAKEIGAATGTAIKVIGNTIRQGYADEGMRGVLNTGMRFDDLGLSKQDQAFVQELHDLGILKLGQAQQLQQAITGASQRKQDVARMASMTAQYAEMTNRLAIGLAAFRMGMRDTKLTGMDARTRAATDFAVKAVNNSMDNFDADNTARLIGKHGFAGKVTPLLTSFMNYNLQTMQQVVRTVQDGYFSKGALPGESAQDFADRKRYAQKEFGGLMATTALISGAMGLPFANAFAGVYNTIHQLINPDDPSDIRQDVRNFLSNTFGDGAGDLISHGVGHLVNMDTSTFGLENLLPGSEFLASRQQIKDRIESQSQNLLGPAINAGLDIVAGAGKIIDGNYVKGIEAMLPSGLKPYYKAVELATRGYTDSRGNPLPMDEPGAWGIGLQAAGFRTAEKADRDERAFNFSQSQQLLAARRQVLGDRFYKAVTANDADAQTDALSSIHDFNAANPYQPMRNLGGEVRQRMMELAIGNVGGFGIPLTKRQLPVAARTFGGMPERE